MLVSKPSFLAGEANGSFEATKPSEKESFAVIASQEMTALALYT